MKVDSSYDQIETAAQITIKINHKDLSQPIEIPVEELDLTKDVDVERIRESGLYPDGYAINSIDIDGSITFAGRKVRSSGGTKNLSNILFLGGEEPQTFTITIVHEATNSEPTTTISNAMVTSEDYTVSSGETTESSYDFIAQRINNPSYAGSGGGKEEPGDGSEGE